jgi:hydroxymethylbilane synthase
LTEHGLHLRGMVGDVHSGRLLLAEAHADGDQAIALGLKVADALLAQGADKLLGH